MKKLDIAISVDDINPSNVEASLEDPFLKKIIKINEKYNLKITFFMPANFLGKYNLKDYKEWCKFFDKLEFIEVAAHGYYHDFEDLGALGYKEFSKINYAKTQERISLIKEAFQHFSLKNIKGWKMPGWEFNPNSLKAISEHYDYIYPHPEHINIYKSLSKKSRIINSTNTFDIQYKNIPFSSLGSDPLILHSHIDGETNENKWTEYNFSKLQLNILDLFQFFKVDAKFVSEL